MKRTLIVIVSAFAAVFIGLVTGVLGVGSTFGPMGYHDGKNHTEVEITLFHQVGYSTERSVGWFRPGEGRMP
jgi:hypothetical protein